MLNILFKDFGTFLNTSKGDQYEINQVVIFKDNQEKMFANYFLDNFRENNYRFVISGDITRKLKKDLSLNTNFVVKSEKQNSWNDKTQYTLYINGDLNNYIFDRLSLAGDQLLAQYKINDNICTQCIGWNQKKSNQIKYHEFEDNYKKINSYSIDNENMENYIQDLLKTYRKYKKAKEEEKTYSEKDYMKMSLSSGTTEEENKIILKNNGFEI